MRAGWRGRGPNAAIRPSYRRACAEWLVAVRRKNFHRDQGRNADRVPAGMRFPERSGRSEEHTSELQSLMRISYAVFCLKKKKNRNITHKNEMQISTHIIAI